MRVIWLSVKQAAKLHLLNQNLEPSRALPTRQKEKTYWNKQHHFKGFS